MTHQEAHEVEGEHGGHASERQPLQHRAADAGRVAVVFALGGAVVLAAARLTPEYRHGNDQRSEHAQCGILAENLREETEPVRTSVNTGTRTMESYSHLLIDLLCIFKYINIYIYCMYIYTHTVYISMFVMIHVHS